MNKLSLKNVLVFGTVTGLLLMSIYSIVGTPPVYAPGQTGTLQNPPARSEWEEHGSGEKGTKSNIYNTNPNWSIGTPNWWWAKGFVYSHVIAYSPNLGAVGAGIIKYIPLDSSSQHTGQAKYEYSVALSRQFYIILDATPSSNPSTYYVEYSGSNGCWKRSTSSQGVDTYCISGMTWGHPRYTVSSNRAANQFSQTETVNKFKNPATGLWDNFSNDNGPSYCRTMGTGSGNGYKVQILSNGNTINMGAATGGTNSCVSGIFTTNLLPG